MATTQRQKMTSGGSVTGLSNACTPGSIVRVAYWCAGRSWMSPIKLSCIWLVVSSAFSTVIAFFPYRFPNKLLALPKSGGFSFVSPANHLTLFPITWPGHSGDARIKLSRDFAITGAEVLLPTIYNCRTKRSMTRIPSLPPVARPRICTI